MKLVLFRLIGTGISWLLYDGVYKITAWPNYAYLILFMVLMAACSYAAEKIYYFLNNQNKHSS